MKKKMLPKFKNLEQESNYWDTHDTTGFFDEDITRDFLLELQKEKKQKITIWLNSDLIKTLKEKSKEYKMPYQVFTRNLLKTAIMKI
ncbi:MAG: CopG family antitoxin [Candidatus Hydrogenedentota bacterium]